MFLMMMMLSKHLSPIVIQLAIYSFQITLTVEQLPELSDGNHYLCVFDNDGEYPATKNGNQLTCVTPGAVKRPLIPSGSGEIALYKFLISLLLDKTEEV